VFAIEMDILLNCNKQILPKEQQTNPAQWQKQLIFLKKYFSQVI
jgi:hypothetical protein